MVQKKCAKCFTPNHIACKRCRLCGNEFSKKYRSTVFTKKPPVEFNTPVAETTVILSTGGVSLGEGDKPVAETTAAVILSTGGGVLLGEGDKPVAETTGGGVSLGEGNKPVAEQSTGVLLLGEGKNSAESKENNEPSLHMVFNPKVSVKICLFCSQPSPIACRRCKICKSSFKMKVDNFQDTTPSAKRSRTVIKDTSTLDQEEDNPIQVKSIEDGRPMQERLREKPKISLSEMDEKVSYSSNVTLKICQDCSKRSPIACKRCRFCGCTFVKKNTDQPLAYVQSTAVKRSRTPSNATKLLEREESPEIPVMQKVKGKPQVTCMGIDLEHEAKLKQLHDEQKERLFYILQGINDKITHT